MKKETYEPTEFAGIKRKISDGKYIDNGQVELTKILTAVFSTLYANIEFRKVSPVDY